MKTLRLTTNAFKGLSKHKLRSFLMMLGIIVGITTLTLIFAVGEGAKRMVVDSMKAFGSDAMMLTAGGGQQMGPNASTATLTEEDAKAIQEEIEGIKNLAPAMLGGGQTIVRGDKNTSAMVFGVTSTWEDAWQWHAVDSDFITDEELMRSERVCLLGQSVVRELFGDENPAGATIRLNNVNFRVKGVMEKRGTSPMGSDMDNRIIIPLTTAARRLFNRTHLSYVRIQVDDPAEMLEVAEKVTALMRERHNITSGEPDDFQVRTPDFIASRIKKVSGTMSTFLGLISGLSLIVGGIIVMNIMLMSVSERKKEIGLRKAVGARKKDILTQFLIECMLITLIGGAIGILLGLGGSKLITMATQIPTGFSLQAFGLAFGFSGLVGLLFGMHPAKKAAELEPVAAMR